jgi:hypothetical protein
VKAEAEAEVKAETEEKSMARPATLERWSADELQELKTMALRDKREAIDVAQEYLQRYPNRSLDAVKQRVFKLRRDAANHPPSKMRPPAAATAGAALNAALSARPGDYLELQLKDGHIVRGSVPLVLQLLKGLGH